MRSFWPSSRCCGRARILLDFLLIDPAPRADTCELLSVASRLRADGIPLYLAVTQARRPGADGRARAAAMSAATRSRAAQVFTPVSVAAPGRRQ